MPSMPNRLIASASDSRVRRPSSTTRERAATTTLRRSTSKNARSDCRVASKTVRPQRDKSRLDKGCDQLRIGANIVRRRDDRRSARKAGGEVADDGFIERVEPVMALCLSRDRRGLCHKAHRNFLGDVPKPLSERGIFGIGAWLGDIAIGEILARHGRERRICRDIALRRRALRNGL
jgi:hypothetical protein